MYVDEGGGTPSGDPQEMGQQLDAIGASLGELTAGAASGDIAVNAEGGQALIEALNHMEDGLNEALQDIDWIIREPPIGDTPVAQVLKPFLMDTADGHHTRSCRTS